MVRRARRSSGRVTLQDVAKYVGISKITVSRVLREPHRVSPELKERVEQAIERLGYIPNRQAGALASARSHSIALLVPSLSNLVFSEVLRGVADVFDDTGYQVLLGHSSYSAFEEERLISTYLSYGVDGFIISGSRHTDRARELLIRSQLPVVEIMELPAKPIDMAVGFSHEQAGFDMTHALIKAGYQRIGFGGARMDHRAQNRLAGWRRAMIEARMDDSACLTTTRPSSYRLGADILADLMARWPELDAIFFCNDDLAAGALFECQRRGIRVPEQLALAGYNGLDITDATFPTLSTVVTPRRRIGLEAARLLKLRLLDETPEETRIDTGYEIAIRGSS
ncbi:HTH-type transcriptional regulator GntR [Phytohalomonas tamaricis]|uniref:LacI family DNA-binding transcriptional regulator n=1 Tax=Phytohalomonas tamaricis TaxID=2081032 RepID=UPI000D0B36FA|nr:LacI family DNA-binding transcriptional regulator [Phytohalomonas tamaricis]